LSGGTHQELKKGGSSHPPEETEASFAKQKSPAGRQMTVAVEINFPPNRDWKKTQSHWAEGSADWESSSANRINYQFKDREQPSM
jgi:hypothetical protein